LGVVDDGRLALPRVKPIYGVFYLAGRVRLGTGVGYAAEVADPDGRYASLIRLLDGTRSVPVLIEELAGTLTEREVHESLDQLVETGYLEDAATPAPASLSDAECERYRANINFFSTLPNSQSRFSHQARLKQLRVALIGLGGIGSNVATALAEVGVGAVTAIDFDRVELSNLNRQVLYSTPEVGQLKAEVAARRMAVFNPEVAFHAVSDRINSVGDVESFLDLAAADVVFCLADKPNGYIDYWVNEVCVRRRLPVFAGSIFAGIGNAYCVLPGEVCYACRVGAELERAPTLDEEIAYIRDTEFNVSNGATGPTCMFHAYFLTYEMLRYVLEFARPLTADALFEIDFVTFEQSFTKFKRRDDCLVCGVAGPVGASA
jgi:molybdopterin/thiamine biosynthesis adenylyltransferase